MNKLMIISGFALLSVSAFARPATRGEVRLVCNAVETSFEEQAADGAVRMGECYRSIGLARHSSEDATVVSIDVPMYIEGRKTTEVCGLTYLHQSAHAANIQGGPANAECEIQPDRRE